MNKTVVCLVALAIGILCCSTAAQAQGTQAQGRPEINLDAQRMRLPNGWSLTPVGSSLPLGDLPLNIVVSPSGKYAAVTNNGESTQTIQLFDAGSQQQLDSVVIPKSWLGLAFSPDEQNLYASGGNDNWILKYAIDHGRLTTVDTFKLGTPWPNKISPAGLAVDAHNLYVVTKEDNSLYVVDIASHQIVHHLRLAGEGYTCMLNPNGKELYLSVWGGSKVMVYDNSSGAFTDSIAVDDNPNDLCLSKNGHYLFVANSNDNSVSVIDLHKHKVLETLNAALYPTRLSGSTTNGVALGSGDKTLYVANADNNCLAVFDVSHPGNSHSLGFIPTGWYPTCVRVLGNKLYVSNGKGFSGLPNPQGPNPYGNGQTVSTHLGDAHKPATVQYVGGGLLMGTLSIVPIPSATLLSVYTQAVYRNVPFTLRGEQDPRKENVLGGRPGPDSLGGKTGCGNMGGGNVGGGNVGGGNNGGGSLVAGPHYSPVPDSVGGISPIKHVFYIIKENRTYDQVMGDVKEGNGDTSLVLFGEKITPNQHALAQEFVLLDNFYVDGEVSSDGHNWSMGAYATDFLEKNWPTMYGRRGDSEMSSGLRKTANNKDGFIWDDCARSGVSYRTYGEFVSSSFKPNIPALAGHLCPYFNTMDMHIMDTLRVHQWEREFDSLVAANALPGFMTVRFANDHTEGMAAGRPTPFAHVADNDLALGMFVDYLSHSPVWKESVVFILEDDAQNGPDHVDAHRSNAYVAGGYVKRHFVDHTMYTTASMLRTMELILGMSPMTQYDAGAMPMWNCFTLEADTHPFEHRQAMTDLGEVNPDKTRLAAMSKGLDFSKEDLVPDQVLNDIIWKAVKGENTSCPSPVRAAFLKTGKMPGSAFGEDD